MLLTRPDVDVLKQNSFGLSSISEALKLNREDIAGTSSSFPGRRRLTLHPPSLSVVCNDNAVLYWLSGGVLAMLCCLVGVQ